MDRLTKDDISKMHELDLKDTVAIINKLIEFEGIGLTPEKIKDHEKMFKAYRHVCGGKSPEEIKALIAERDELKNRLESATKTLLQVTKKYFALKIVNEAVSSQLTHKSKPPTMSELMHDIGITFNLKDVTNYLKYYMQAQEEQP